MPCKYNENEHEKYVNYKNSFQSSEIWPCKFYENYEKYMKIHENFHIYYEKIKCTF